MKACALTRAAECHSTELELQDQCSPQIARRSCCPLRPGIGAPEDCAGDVVAEADAQVSEGGQSRDGPQVLVEHEALGDGQGLQTAQLREEADAFAAAAQFPGPAQVQVAQISQLRQAGVADVLEAEGLADVQQLQAWSTLEQVNKTTEGQCFAHKTIGRLKPIRCACTSKALWLVLACWSIKQLEINSCLTL